MEDELVVVHVWAIIASEEGMDSDGQILSLLHLKVFGSPDEPLTEEEIFEEESSVKRKRRGRRNAKNRQRTLYHRVKVQVQNAQRKGNTMIIPAFKFLQATHVDSKVRKDFFSEFQGPSEETLWDDDDCQRVMSGDGYDLVYHFPRGMTDKERMGNLLMEYAKAVDVRVRPTADKFHRNNPNSYIQRPAEIAGVTHLVRSWHGIGRTHASLTEARAKAEEKYAFVETLDAIDPLLMEGRALMFNRMTPGHVDRRDPPKAWACLVVLGRITSGYLYLKQLKLRLRYTPGVVVWLRGALLDHEVEAWEGEQRIAIAHFTHQAYFEDLGLQCETQPGRPPY
ncbi:hypothetical protein C8R42DRAFT_638943 [Lentinula raphanica]|nr:hypothetical protein C8R42DRAFT_638943 [Lentinula raphanica]